MADSRRLAEVLFWLCSIALPAYSQTAGQETLSGGDGHEPSRPDTRYLSVTGAASVAGKGNQ
jgi:hypothetical protein